MVDLGAGTGKLTRQLAGTIIAVEPVDAMRRKFASVLPEVSVIGGLAEHIALRDCSADAVVCAQAFHWFDAGSAISEMHRILKPGGGIALIWNGKDARVDWVARLDAITSPYQGSLYEDLDDWESVFAGSPLFGSLERSRFEFSHPISRDMVVDRVMSTSFIALLPDAQRHEVRQRVAEVASDLPDEVAFPYVTDLFCCSVMK